MNDIEAKAKVIAEGIIKKDPKYEKILQGLITKAQSKKDPESLELLQMVQKLLQTQQMTPAYGKGRKICNCPSKLAKQGGKLVIVDCHGQIIR